MDDEDRQVAQGVVSFCFCFTFLVRSHHMSCSSSWSTTKKKTKEGVSGGGGSAVEQTTWLRSKVRRVRGCR